MRKCRKCGAEFEPSKSFALGSIIGMQFGFEFSMIIFGGYVAVCIYSFQSIFVLIISLAIGVFTFYALLPKANKICEGCISK